MSERMRVSQAMGLIIIVILGGGQRQAASGEHWLNDPASNRKTQDDAYRRIPFAKLTPQAAEKMRDVVERPSFFRRMPTQTLDCDPELFTFLVRYPEVLVNIWDVMDITKVTVKRISPFVFHGQDGAGTTCRCDLVYGHPDLHIYYGDGSYTGNLAPREITGRCVCILHSKNSQSAAGVERVTGTMDVYLKLDNLGADLLTRTLGPFVGKTADYNFVESAKFVSQIDDVCENNPAAAQQLASRLDKVDPQVRERFSRLAAKISASGESDGEQVVLPQRRISDTAENRGSSRRTLSAFVEPGDETRPAQPRIPASPPDEPPIVSPQKPQIYMRR